MKKRLQEIANEVLDKLATSCEKQIFTVNIEERRRKISQGRKRKYRYGCGLFTWAVHDVYVAHVCLTFAAIRLFLFFSAPYTAAAKPTNSPPASTSSAKPSAASASPKAFSTAKYSSSKKKSSVSTAAGPSRSPRRAPVDTPATGIGKPPPDDITRSLGNMDLNNEDIELHPQMKAAQAAFQRKEDDGVSHVQSFLWNYSAVIVEKFRRTHLSIDILKPGAIDTKWLDFSIQGEGPFSNRLLVLQFNRLPSYVSNPEYILEDYTFNVPKIKAEGQTQRRARYIESDEPFAQGYEITAERTRKNTHRMVIPLPWEVETNIEKYNGFPIDKLEENPSTYCIHQETYKAGRVSDDNKERYLEEVGMYQFIKVVLRKKERSTTKGRSSTGHAMSPTNTDRRDDGTSDLYA